MDRQFVYPTEEVQDVDILLTNKNAMVGLGYFIQTVLGTNTIVDGLACTPTGPATLTVNVGTGSIYSLTQVDATAYGSVAADTINQIMKQGIVVGTTNFSCAAPGTSGQSVVYLIQAKYQDVDGGSTNEPFVSATDGSVSYSTVNTVRKGVCVLAVKTGSAAATGSQATPAPDAGYTGLYAITVANGQSTVTSGNIAPLATAPFIASKLATIPALIQSGTPMYAADTSGSANTITLALSPIPASLAPGQPIRVKVANANTGAVVMNVNGLGNVAVHDSGGNALQAGALQANGIYSFSYDGSYWQLQRSTARQILTGNLTLYVRSSGSDTTGNGTSGSPWASLQKAATYIENFIDTAGYSVTINAATSNGTPVAFSGPVPGGGNIILQGDLTTPTNAPLSSTSGPAIYSSGSNITIGGFSPSTSTNLASAVYADRGGIILVNGLMNYPASTGTGASQLGAADDGQIFIGQGETVGGGAASHYAVTRGGRITNLAGADSVSFTAAVTYTTAFAVFADQGEISVPGIIFSGSAVTGPRYLGTNLALCNTNGGGANYFPGNSAGTATSGNPVYV